MLKRKMKNTAFAEASMIESKTPGTQVINILLAGLLLLFAFCCFIPLWHVLMASLSDGRSLLSHVGILWTPKGALNFKGYEMLFSNASVMMGYGNTLLYVVATAGLGLVLNALGGYVLSRKSKLAPFLTLLVTFTMLFNGGLIPNYMVLKTLGLVGTRWALILPSCTNAFFMIMMMNGYRQVPEATVESARIDGAGHIRILFQIMLPQARSMMIVTILNTVIMQWNSWFPASIYVTNQRNLWPLQLWIKQLVAENVDLLQSSNPDYNRWLIQYAVIIAATLPILIALPFFQEKLEKGMLMGGVKE